MSSLPGRAGRRGGEVNGVRERVDRWLVNMLTALTLRRAILLIVGLGTALSIGAALLERLIDPAFATLGQALWWSVSTVTTTGYGDIVPESPAGRFVATVLMLVGLALIPLITSAVVSVLIAQRTGVGHDQESRDLQRMLELLESLDRRLSRLETDG
jgi:voltage-gated potassium channel Kch